MQKADLREHASGAIHTGIARFTIKPGHDRDFADGFKVAIASMPANPGRLQFELYREPDPLRFLLYQTFVSDEAWEAHRTSPQTRASYTALEPMMQGAPERTIWRPLQLFGEAIAPPNGRVVHSTMTVVRVAEGTLGNFIELLRGDAERRRRAVKMIRIDVSCAIDDRNQVMILTRWPLRSTWEEDRLDSAHATFRSQASGLIEGPTAHTLLSGDF